MRFVTEPLWARPPVPWWLQAGAVALWCGLAGLVVYGLALALPAPWYEVGWLSFPTALVAVALGVWALAISSVRQKGLGLAGLVAVGLFVLVLRQT